MVYLVEFCFNGISVLLKPGQSLSAFIGSSTAGCKVGYQIQSFLG